MFRVTKNLIEIFPQQCAGHHLVVVKVAADVVGDQTDVSREAIDLIDS